MTLWQKVKLLLTLKKAVTDLKEATKMGIKTSEFWITALSILAAVAGAVAGYLDPAMVLKFAAVAVPVYVLARAIVKFTPTPKDDVIVSKIEEVLKKLGIAIPPEK